MATAFDYDPYISGPAEELLFLDLPLGPPLGPPWTLAAGLAAALQARLPALDPAEYRIGDGIAVHRDAMTEPGAVLKPPVLVMAGCLVAAHAYLRGGVLLGPGARIGPGAEVKSSLILAGSTLAHFNFVGDSILGRDVNLEAGAVIANHFNERSDRRIVASDRGRKVETGVTRFGALLGDGTRIGANAVVSPGVLLPRGTVVGRLELMPPAD